MTTFSLPFRPLAATVWRRLATCAVFGLALVATPAAAQSLGGRAALPPAPYSRIVSINPLLLVFLGNVSADLEQRVSPSVTLGGSVASFNLAKANYLSIEGKARYYLSGRAFDGVSVLASVGVVSMSADETDATSNAMSIGFGAERQWLVGPEERLALAAGLGASRLFFARDDDAFRTILPSLRLSIGWGF
jgi:hypothetical protein